MKRGKYGYGFGLDVNSGILRLALGSKVGYRKLRGTQDLVGLRLFKAYEIKKCFYNLTSCKISLRDEMAS